MSSPRWDALIRTTLFIAVSSAAFAQQQAAPAQAASGQAQQQAAASHVQQSPLSRLRSGREAGNNNQILTTGIRTVQPDANYALQLPSNHALIITVSEYQKSPLPGVLTDRKLGIELAQRLGVPPQNIVELSEQQVTREGLKQAFASMNQVMMPGDKLYVYFSGHGARFFSKATGQCTESLVMQDMHVVTNTEFANMIKPLSAKADKTIVMLDSCHSGGVAQAAGSRSLAAQYRPKFSPEASSPQCALAVNLGSFSQARGVDFHTTDHNMVILAAARNNEVAWDTSKGGAMTYNFERCLAGGADDTDHSGALSMQELTACVQARLDKTQEESARQHATLAGNAALVPAFSGSPSSAPSVPDGNTASPTSNAAPVTAPAAAPAPGAPAPTAIDTLATLNDIYSQRDDRWEVLTTLASPTLKIGSNLSMSIRSQRDGFVYLFYRGTQADSFYLLFPNSLDSANAIKANKDLPLPRQDWSVTALGPKGTDHLMVMVTDTPRDFSALALPADYVSKSGPFEKIQPTSQAVARIGQIATLSVAVAKKECRLVDADRDLGVARRCSNVFGASLVTVQETD
ncbi:MAG: caspase family protein [Pseudomonadota bacterium]|nr:caspase family protein [Pseudomonadota bacterium]